MPQVWKDIFRAGTYRDHTGTPHTFTTADVVDAYHNGRAMLRSHIPISPPGVWEHDWQSVPEPIKQFLSRIGSDRDRRAAEAKNAFGWAKDYRVTFERDQKTGRHQPVLHALLEVPDAKDLEQLAKTRFVSPRVDWDFRDTIGRTWKGCAVTHIAATHSPVQIDQRPLMLGQLPSSKTLFLGAPMADDAKKTDTAASGAGSDIAGRLKAICANMNWPVPDGATTPEDMLLVMESHSLKTGDTDTDPNGDGTTTPASTVTPQLLSTLAPEERKQVEQWQKQAAAVTARDKAAIMTRFKAIVKPCAERQLFGDKTVERLRDLERRVKGVNLSYTAEGELEENGLIRELETIEAAVKATNPNPDSKDPPTVRAVDLSQLGLGNPDQPARPPEKPGDPGWDQAIEEIRSRRVARVAIGEVKTDAKK